MIAQAEKGEAFAALHRRARTFIIPNPWDLGSARMLELLGFEALATTSAGFAFTLGKRDGAVSRDRMLAHCTEIAGASDLPVSGDLENGYADEPQGVAQTVALAAQAGLVGCSIEDVPQGAERTPYPLELAAARVEAAVRAARALPFSFTLTARAENFIIGRPDLADTIARLRAYEVAGADVLYAPGVGAQELAEIVKAVRKPVNALAFIGGPAMTLDEAARLGVRRISIGGSLARAAYGGAFHEAQRMLRGGPIWTEQAPAAFSGLARMLEGPQQGD